MPRSGAERQEALQRGLLEERVPPGEQEAVEVAVPHAALEDLPLVGADADRADDAGGAEIVQRAIRPVHGLAIPGVVVRAVGDRADVVDQHDVHPLEAQALEARGERLPRRCGRVVEHRRQRRRVDVRALPGRLGGPGDEAPPDLGREDEGVAGLAVERRADPPLAQPVAVQGGGVVVTHAGSPGGAHGVDGLGLRDGAEEIAERRAPEPEARHPHRGAPERAGLRGIDRHAAHAGRRTRG